MSHDILAAIPWGVLLAFTIGPVFFVLLETGAIKGFRAAFVFDMGVVVADILFILIAYFSTNQILEELKDEPGLFIFGGGLLIAYGVVSYINCKREFAKNVDEDIHETVPKKNYLNLVLKGFLLNFINIGVLGFWLGVIIVFGPKLEMRPDRLTVFFGTIIATYLCVDCIKIILAKQLKRKLTHLKIFRIKRVISVILVIFGIGLMLQAFFPNEKAKIKNAIEDIRRK